MDQYYGTEGVEGRRDVSCTYFWRLPSISDMGMTASYAYCGFRDIQLLTLFVSTPGIFSINTCVHPSQLICVVGHKHRCLLDIGHSLPLLNRSYLATEQCCQISIIVTLAFSCSVHSSQFSFVHHRHSLLHAFFVAVLLPSQTLTFPLEIRSRKSKNVTG